MAREDQQWLVFVLIIASKFMRDVSVSQRASIASTFPVDLIVAIVVVFIGFTTLFGIFIVFSRIKQTWMFLCDLICFSFRNSFKNRFKVKVWGICIQKQSMNAVYEATENNRECSSQIRRNFETIHGIGHIWTVKEHIRWWGNRMMSIEYRMFSAKNALKTKCDESTS